MLRSRKKGNPKRVLALPDLEQAKSAVLNTLTSKSVQRTYDHAITEFVEWYCSEPRLAFNRTVVLRYRINLEQKQQGGALRLSEDPPSADTPASLRLTSHTDRPHPTPKVMFQSRFEETR